MATSVSRSNAEVLARMKAEWSDVTSIDAVFVDTSSAGTPPTAASSMTTWLPYALVDPFDLGLIEGYPWRDIITSAFSFDTGDGRAESPLYTWNFTAFIAADFSLFSSTTVTHILLCDAYELDRSYSNPPYFVLTESPSLTLTSSTSLSRSLRLFGREAA
jgi:hypothetical protein